MRAAPTECCIENLRGLKAGFHYIANLKGRCSLHSKFKRKHRNLISRGKTFILMRAVPTEWCNDPENSTWEAGKFHVGSVLARITFVQAGIRSDKVGLVFGIGSSEGDNNIESETVGVVEGHL